MLSITAVAALRFISQKPAASANAVKGASKFIAKNAAAPQRAAALKFTCAKFAAVRPKQSPKSAPSEKLGVRVPPYAPHFKSASTQTPFTVSKPSA